MAAAVDVSAAEEGDRLPVAQPHPVEDILSQVGGQALPPLLGCHSADKFWLNLTVHHAPLGLTPGFVTSFYVSYLSLLARLQLLSSQEKKKMIEELLKRLKQNNRTSMSNLVVPAVENPPDFWA